jgi:hypothetical protein
MIGAYREDGFYLFPTSAHLRTGEVRVKTANGSAFGIFDFPDQRGPPFLGTIQNPDPLPNALPDRRVLQAFLKATTAGFPILDSFPQGVVSEPKGVNSEGFGREDGSR